MSIEYKKTFGKASPAGTPAQIIGPNPDRIALTLRNAGAVTVYLGKDSTVTTSTGFPLEAGDVLKDDGSIDSYWGVTAGSAGDVRSIEVS